MDFLATPRRRKFLFASLYFSEGAPIGFLWLALPTLFRARGVPVEEITQFAAVLVIPWTFKFAWAPLVDLLRSRWWTLKQWIIAAQIVMAAMLTPLLFLDLQDDFPLIVSLLVVHAVAAATQDVAIDALCISVTQPQERGAYNGWMQAGMLLGRSLLGGGALVLAARFGENFAVGLLIGCVSFSAVLIGMSRIAEEPDEQTDRTSRARTVLVETLAALKERPTWLGLAFALIGGAAFKSLEVVIGPFLIDRGFDKSEIGWFTALAMIGAMIAGALTGGIMADRLHRRRSVVVALVWFVVAIALLAGCDVALGHRRSSVLLVLLATTAFGIGLFTAASYALFMDLTRPRIAGTQFSAFMGATNGCEAWSVVVFGQIVAAWSYPTAMLAMCGASLVAVLFVGQMRLGGDRE